MTDRGTAYEGTAPVTDGARRVALVIGNAAYPAAALKNPRNDAKAFASQLKAVHPAFDVTLALDVGRDAMEDALEAFEAKLANCDTALLFFAGHGLQVKGINYLMPVDADIRQEIHLKRRAVSLNEILDIMGRRVRSSSLVFLDACRDNPFARSLLAGLPDDERGRFLTRSGLAEVRAGAGSFVAFATAPDNVALDGTGANSPFTAALVEHMAAPNASINDVMIAVRRDVLKATGGRQEPWDQSSLRERFSFHCVPEPVTLVAPTPAEPQLSESGIFEMAALEHWEAVKGTTDPARLRSFLADYGTSRMGPLAREAMQRLATAAWRKLNRRDEAALARFIDDYAGTSEVAEASAVVATLQAAREAAAQKAAQKAKQRSEKQSGTVGLGNLLAGAAALVVLGGGVAWWQPWRDRAPSSPDVAPVGSAKGPEPKTGGQVLPKAGEQVAIVAPPAAPPLARCTGVEVDVVGTGKICLDPKDEKNREFQDCKGSICGPQMIVIPSGRFLMGSPENEKGRGADEGPQHEVEMPRAFAAGVTHVTRGEFAAFVAATAHKTDGGCYSYVGTEWKQDAKASWRAPGFEQDDGHPVVCVNWHDAQAYAAWLKQQTGAEYRLLTEAEAEYIARGTTTATSQPRYFFGDDPKDLCKYGNGADLTGAAKFNWDKSQVADCKDGYVYTAPVGHFAANAFGVKDVHGNAWSWAQDCFVNSYKDPPSDGSKAVESKDCRYRVLRGGSWNISPQFLRSADRGRSNPDLRLNDIGFRVARSVSR